MQSNLINDSNDLDFNTINTPKVDDKNINTRRSSKNKLLEPYFNLFTLFKSIRYNTC